jgi:hypothetical protein
MTVAHRVCPQRDLTRGPCRQTSFRVRGLLRIPHEPESADLSPPLREMIKAPVPDISFATMYPCMDHCLNFDLSNHVVKPSGLRAAAWRRGRGGFARSPGFAQACPGGGRDGHPFAAGPGLPGVPRFGAAAGGILLTGSPSRGALSQFAKASN